MLELYYTDAESVHEQLKTAIAPHICGNFEISRTPDGKPYVEGNPVYFSISHSRGKAVIAVCDKPVGVDMELFGRRNFKTVLSRFTLREQTEIGQSQEKFLENWTVKEAYVKMKGAGIFSYLRRLEYVGGVLYVDGKPLNCNIFLHELDYGIVSVCVDPQY